jgi:hypothetical protein
MMDDERKLHEQVIKTTLTRCCQRQQGKASNKGAAANSQRPFGVSIAKVAGLAAAHSISICRAWCLCYSDYSLMRTSTMAGTCGCRELGHLMRPAGIRG